MRINVSNKAQLPNKHIRFIKWKFYQTKAKFQQLHYVEVFLNTEGQSPKNYIAKVRLGIPGNDIIIQNQSQHLSEIFRKTYSTVHRTLSSTKKSKITRRVETQASLQVLRKQLRLSTL